MRDPTPEEIKEECALIRAGWDNDSQRRRSAKRCELPGEAIRQVSRVRDSGELTDKELIRWLLYGDSSSYDLEAYTSFRAKQRREWAMALTDEERTKLIKRLASSMENTGFLPQAVMALALECLELRRQLEQTSEELGELRRRVHEGHT